MRISDWSSDVCSSELAGALRAPEARDGAEAAGLVAALGHLHVGPRDRARRAGQAEQVEGGARRLAGLSAERDRHADAGDGVGRTAERCVGEERVSPCICRWSHEYRKKK